MKRFAASTPSRAWWPHRGRVSPRLGKLRTALSPSAGDRGCIIPHAFTLLEIVLALALSALVLYLLTTAIDLYLVRVDASRSRVESAQLARTLLDQIAADLSATRHLPPARQAAGQAGAGGQSSTGGGSAGSRSGASTPGGGTGPGGAPGGNSPGAGRGATPGGRSPGSGSSGGPAGSGASGSAASGAGSAVAAPIAVTGVYGAADAIRIDRAARPNWRRAAREVAVEETTSVDDWPATVRYFVVDGDRVTSQQLAQQGVSAEPSEATTTGLYRETIPTAALAADASVTATPTQRDGARVEFLAPEVVGLQLAYSDGTQLLDTWDSELDGGLPAGVEIRLTLYQPASGEPTARESRQPLGQNVRYTERELVEYRRFVRLPAHKPAAPAEALLPAQPAGGGPVGQAAAPGENNAAPGGGDGGGTGGPGGGPGGGDDNPS